MDCKKYKIIVVGDSNVGKTSLTYRACDGIFDDNNIVATVGVDFRSKVVQIDGEEIELNIWDTAGSERFHSISRQYFKDADAIIFVYDITDKKSFNNLPLWITECDNYCKSDIIKFLIGNKCDGAYNVPRQQAQLFAALHNMTFFETSAKLDSECETIKAIFYTLAYKLKQKPLITDRSTVDLTKDSNQPSSQKSGCSC